MLTNKSKGCRKYYDIMTKKHSTIKSKPQQKWNSELNILYDNSTYTWKHAYELINKTTMNTNLKYFQY